MSVEIKRLKPPKHYCKDCKVMTTQEVELSDGKTYKGTYCPKWTREGKAPLPVNPELSYCDQIEL